MSPCLRRGDVDGPPPENFEAMTITFPTPTHRRKPPVHITTTVDEIVIVVNEGGYTGTPAETEKGFVTSTLAGSASTSTLTAGPASTSTLTGPRPTSTSTPETSVYASTSASSHPLSTTSATASIPVSESSQAATSSSSISASASSSSSDLKPVSGAKATIQPPGTGVNNGSSPTGTILHSTSAPLNATSTSQSTPVGAIIGVSIAGVLVIALVVLLVVLWAQRRSARNARNAETFEGGMRQRPPITPFPTDLQPNRAGGRVQNWTAQNSHLVQPAYGAHPTLVANQQYPFAPPVAVPASPLRPARRRGDTLSSLPAVGSF